MKHTLAYVTLLCCLMAWQCAIGNAAPAGQVFQGTGRISAAVAIDPDLFAVSTVDDNLLRIYHKNRPNAPVTSLDISEFLGLTEGVMTDLCGATRQGDRIYWIGSHSRNGQGQVRSETYCFFATDIRTIQGKVTLVQAGRPCTDLLRRLPSNSIVRTLRLDRALGTRDNMSPIQRRRLTPTQNGLHISALAADPRIGVLHIGFRNPRPMRVITGTPHALTIPLNNPAEVIDQGKDPIFGEATLWDLNGLGVTGMEYSERHRRYIIVAQPHHSMSPCVLYEWTGMKANSPLRMCQLDNQAGQTGTVTLAPWNQSNGLPLFIGSDDEFRTILVDLPQ